MTHYVGGGGGIGIPVKRAGGGGTGLNIGGLGGGGGGTGTIEGPNPGRIRGTGGGTFPIDGFSFLKANCRKNCFVSLFQCVQNFPSAFSTSLLGTCKKINIFINFCKDMLIKKKKYYKNYIININSILCNKCVKYYFTR